MQRPLVPALAALIFGTLVLAGLTTVFAADTGPDVEPTSTPAVPVPDAPKPSPTAGFPTDPAPAVPDRGPNGMPIEHEPGRELASPGLETPRPVDQGAGADVWAERRRANDAKWVKKTLDVSIAWAERELTDPGERAAVLTAIQVYVDTVGRTRAGMASGAIAPADGREAMAGARAAVKQSVSTAIGDERAEVLRSRLEKSQLGGGW